MKIKVFIFIGILCCSLTSLGQSANTSLSKVTIKNTFSFQTIKAYQESAVFKIKDYYNYLELYADESTSDTLRNQLRTTLNNLFVDESQKVVDFTTSENHTITLPKLLDKIRNKNYKFNLSSIENSIVAQDFWTTKYNLEVLENNQRCNIGVFTKVILKPIQKNFGTKTKVVWTLFLGEMESEE
jgi:disulfide oxidoreductase YuzD